MTMTSEMLNLRDAYRQVMESSDVSDTAEIRDALFAMTPPDQYAYHYNRLLMMFVVQCAAEDRKRAGLSPSTMLSELPKTSYDHTPHARSHKRMAALARRAPKKEILTIVGANGKRIRLVDAVYADLVHAAEHCESIASANTIKAHEYRQLAELLNKRGVAQVKDLSEAELAHIFGGAA